MRTSVMLMVVAACDAGRAPVTPEAARFASGFTPTIVGVLVPEPVVAGDYAMALDVWFDLFVTPQLRTTAERHGVIELRLGTDHRIHGCVAVRKRVGTTGEYRYEPILAKRLGYHGDRDASVAAIGGSWKTVAGVSTISIEKMWPGSCDEQGPAPVTPDNEVALIELQCIATAKTAKLIARSLLCQEPADDLLGLGMPLNVAIESSSDMIAPQGTQLVLAPGGLSMKFTVDNGPAMFSITPQALMIDPAAYE